MMPMYSNLDKLTSIAKYFSQRHSMELFLQKFVNMEINERTM